MTALNELQCHDTLHKSKTGIRCERTDQLQIPMVMQIYVDAGFTYWVGLWALRAASASFGITVS